MFTGIIEALGSVEQKERIGGDLRLRIGTATLDLADVHIGDSIATNGVCLTVVELGTASFVADVSSETLSLTTVDQLSIGAKVNLEKALQVQQRLGGHIVSGHVDGMAKIVAIEGDARSQRYTIQLPAELSHYVVHKGSITVDGVSLTVNAVNGTCFELCIVPHTLQETIFSEYRIGSVVNIEIDVVARYVERLLQTADASSADPDTGISSELLRNSGFIKD